MIWTASGMLYDPIFAQQVNITRSYIVDFEDSGYYNVGDPEVNFDEDYYSFWGLTESGRM